MADYFAHCIRLNDSIEAVFVDKQAVSDAAEDRRAFLERDYASKNPGVSRPSTLYWHITTVPCTVVDPPGVTR